MFKNILGEEDRVNVAPVKINLKPGHVPVFSARPFDTPYHLRGAYDCELRDILRAEILEPMGLRESDWCSRAFPVLKGDGSSVRLVTDFKSINRCIKRPNHPTDSANQLLRQISPTQDISVRLIVFQLIIKFLLMMRLLTCW